MRKSGKVSDGCLLVLDIYVSVCACKLENVPFQTMSYWWCSRVSTSVSTQWNDPALLQASASMASLKMGQLKRKDTPERKRPHSARYVSLNKHNKRS